VREDDLDLGRAWLTDGWGLGSSREGSNRQASRWYDVLRTLIGPILFCELFRRGTGTYGCAGGYDEAARERRRRSCAVARTRKLIRPNAAEVNHAVRLPKWSHRAPTKTEDGIKSVPVRAW